MFLHPIWLFYEPGLPFRGDLFRHYVQKPVHFYTLFGKFFPEKKNIGNASFPESLLRHSHAATAIRTGPGQDYCHDASIFIGFCTEAVHNSRHHLTCGDRRIGFEDTKMMKTYLPGIVALLFILAVIAAACVQTPVTPGPDTNRDEIHYNLYGGFVAPSYAVQNLVVTRDKATFTIMSADGNVTERFEKALTNDQFNAIVNVFSDNNFTSFGDRYDEGQNHVTDVGFADITLIEGNRTKTVTTYNINNYMPDGLILIREKLQETVTYVRSPDESEVRQIAETWIREAPTYAYDGSGLTIVNDTLLESSPLRDMLTYRFTSSHGGYGNRSGMVTAQVMTEHTIRITTADRDVESAVIDERWNEMGQFLIGSTLSLSYQPMQCEKTVWQTWEVNSGRVYIRAPTDAEIIRHYYSSVYSIDVMNVTRVDSGLMSCQACSVCPETYHFGLTVNASERQPLLDEGWTRNG
jgi:hypothetical protein